MTIDKEILNLFLYDIWEFKKAPDKYGNNIMKLYYDFFNNI